MSLRQPAVAGAFYEGDRSALRAEVESCFLGRGGPGRLPAARRDGPRGIAGLVCPHAGYVYSGPTAAHAYCRLAEDGLAGTVVLIGPAHRVPGAPVAVAADEAWRTPLGDVPIDAAAAEEIVAAYPAAASESRDHRVEHSLEVQLPFLQYAASLAHAEVRIVPILIGVSVHHPQASELARGLGAALAGVLKARDAVIIASTDFTHYESQQSARRKDSAAIERILALDAGGLIDVVREMDISMCGVMPTAVCIEACKGLGATSGRELAYRTSGDVTGDHREVVGYAAIEIGR